ncbi:hypothetical protein, partial [Sedimenticola sp.]|uniref:hypothetical protein n=1 Tax=Sedimenticola sp. TaxID=1940285 RepID=UPI003D12221A
EAGYMSDCRLHSTPSGVSGEQKGKVAIHGEIEEVVLLDGGRASIYVLVLFGCPRSVSAYSFCILLFSVLSFVLLQTDDNHPFQPSKTNMTLIPL